jgi:chemotaxis protein MotB
MLQAELADAIEQRLGAEDAPEIEVTATDEGIVVNLTDAMDFSMFGIGSAIPNPVLVVAMDQVGHVLAGWPGDIVIRGYTDGRPFRSESYDNWRLSTARAHMAYYMLTRGGELAEERVQRIEGFADRDLRNAADPLAAENRRIEVLLEPAA